jgi:hypothetical protein
MLPKLELDALSADLGAISALLAKKSEQKDPIGYLQLLERKQEVETAIMAVKDQSMGHAAVGLFFGGTPVIGSKGVLAKFAGKAIEAFQEVVSRQLAFDELSSLGSRGPVPFALEKQLMVTDVARGSFGFVLEEADRNGSLAPTAIKIAVADSAKLIAAISSQSDDEFEKAVDSLDPRLLQSLKKFFALLDDSQATIRLVEDEHEMHLDQPAVTRARTRTDQIDIDERETDLVTGQLIGLLPQHRRFEMKLSDSGELISGTISQEISKRALDSALASTDQLVGRFWRTKMKVREVTERNREPRNVYTLLALLEDKSKQK